MRNATNAWEVVLTAAGSVVFAICAGVAYALWILAVETEPVGVQPARGQYVAFWLLPVFTAHCFVFFWTMVALAIRKRSQNEGTIITVAWVVAAGLSASTYGVAQADADDWLSRVGLALYLPFACVTMTAIGRVAIASLAHLRR